MALLDFLKRKKEIQKAKGKSPEKVLNAPITNQSRVRDGKTIGTKELKKESVNDKIISPKKSVSENKFSYEIVKEPHISEKATNLMQKNQYIFKTYSKANKQEIKKSIEGIYGVNVLSVKIINIPKKKRRLGRIEGFKKGHSKAIVTIKEGQKIEVI